MTTTVSHWTERSLVDYLYSLAADFVRQLEDYMESNQKTQADLAKALEITPGRVSQVLNNPGNLTLKNIVRYARALGLKVALVAYDDKDAKNERGPIPAQVFNVCWERSGRPADFFELAEFQQPTVQTVATKPNIVTNFDGTLFFITGDVTSVNLPKNVVPVNLPAMPLPVIVGTSPKTSALPPYRR